MHTQSGIHSHQLRETWLHMYNNNEGNGLLNKRDGVRNVTITLANFVLATFLVVNPHWNVTYAGNFKLVLKWNWLEKQTKYSCTVPNSEGLSILKGNNMLRMGFLFC